MITDVSLLSPFAGADRSRVACQPKLARGRDPVRRRGEIQLQPAHAVDRIRQSVARIILPGAEVAGLTIP